MMGQNWCTFDLLFCFKLAVEPLQKLPRIDHHAVNYLQSSKDVQKNRIAVTLSPLLASPRNQ